MPEDAVCCRTFHFKYWRKLSATRSFCYDEDIINILIIYIVKINVLSINNNNNINNNSSTIAIKIINKIKQPRTTTMTNKTKQMRQGVTLLRW